MKRDIITVLVAVICGCAGIGVGIIAFALAMLGMTQESIEGIRAALILLILAWIATTEMEKKGGAVWQEPIE